MKKRLILAIVLLGSPYAFGSESATKPKTRNLVVPATFARTANYANYSKDTLQTWLKKREAVLVVTRMAEAKAALLTSLLHSNSVPNHILDAALEDLIGVYRLLVTNEYSNDEAFKDEQFGDKEFKEFGMLTMVAFKLKAGGAPLADNQKAELSRMLLQTGTPTVAKAEHKREIKADNCCTAFSILVALGLLGYMTGFHLHLL